MLRRVFPLVMMLMLTIYGGISADETDPVPVNVDGHQFSYPLALYNGFQAAIINQAIEYPDGFIQPPHVEFLLQNTDFDSRSLVGQPGYISIYPVDAMTDYDAFAQVERLQQLLAERPDLAEEPTLPTLYPFQATSFNEDQYREFFVRAAYLQTPSYDGITFIYGRIVSVNDGQPTIFYRAHFEALSTDQQFYVSAQVELLDSRPEALSDITGLEETTAAAVDLFTSWEPEDFTPSLTHIEQLFLSLAYAP